MALLSGQPRCGRRRVRRPLAARYPKSDEACRRHLLGRPRAVPPPATRWPASRWAPVAAGDPGSYYVGRALAASASRPGRPPPRPTASPPSPTPDSAMARATLLARLGLTAESHREYDRLARQRIPRPQRLLALANRFRGHGLRRPGHPARPPRPRSGCAARRPDLPPAVPGGACRGALLAEASASTALDASFVAALIRQESMFDPAATSAGRCARPDAGDARARGPPGPVAGLSGLGSGAALPARCEPSARRPSISRSWPRRIAQPVHVLAAYNAGASRVERWSPARGSTIPRSSPSGSRSPRREATSARFSATRRSTAPSIPGPRWARPRCGRRPGRIPRRPAYPSGCDPGHIPGRRRSACYVVSLPALWRVPWKPEHVRRSPLPRARLGCPRPACWP